MTGKHMITLYDPATGAIHSCRSANKGREADVCGDMAWIDGEHEGRIDPDTGTAAAPMWLDVTIGPNLIAGIPDGTMVIANGEAVEPEGGTLRLDVEHDETVHVRLIHPLYEPAVVHVDCAPADNGSGGHSVDQDFVRMRIGGYEKVASLPDQVDALIKVMNAIIPRLTAPQRAAIPADALAVLDGIADVKRRIVKKGQGK